MFARKHRDILPDHEPLHQLAALVSGKIAPCDIPAGQWHRLIDLALNHGLHPMLLRAVKSSGMDAVSCENWQTLVASVRQTAAADMLYEASIRSISQAFAAAHIPAIWLKGAALARTIYPQSILRPMADLDVLVPDAHIEAALDTLRSLQYKFDAKVLYRPGRPDRIDEAYLKNLARHHHVLIGGGGGAVTVELHFGLPTYTSDRLLPREHMAWFWEHTRSFYLDDHTCCTCLAPEAHLLFLAAHNIIQHGELEAYLMRDLDVHLLVMQQCPDWNAIIDQAVVLGWTYAVARTLERAVDLYATPVPDKVFAQLAERRPAHEDLSLVLKTQSPGFRWEYTKEVLADLPMRGKIRYLFEKLFPATGFMRSHYKVPPHKPIWPYYPFRLFDLSRKASRAIGYQLRMAKAGKP